MKSITRVGRAIDGLLQRALLGAGLAVVAALSVILCISLGIGATLTLGAGTAILIFGSMWPVLWLASRLGRRGSESVEEHDDESMHLISVIVPARNEESVIGEMVSQMRRQTCSAWELLVVANNCSDGTSAEARRAAAGDPRVQVLEFTAERGSKAKALNYALARVNGPIVLELDADNRIDDCYLEGLSRSFTRDVDAVQTQIRASNLLEGILPRLQDLEFLIYSEVFNRGRQALGLSSTIGGTGFAIRTDVIRRLNGWDNGLVEDFQLHLKLVEAGVCVRYESALTVYDEKPATWSALVRQRRRWIRGHLQEAIRSENLGHGLANDLYLLSPVFIALSVALLLAAYIYGFAPQIAGSYAYFSPAFWIGTTALTAIAVVDTLVRVGERRSIPLVPLYVLLFSFHWIIVLAAALRPASWGTTKTEHGQRRARGVLGNIGVDGMRSAALFLSVVLVAALWSYPTVSSLSHGLTMWDRPLYVLGDAYAYASVMESQATPVDVTGRVVDAWNQPIAGAQVVVVHIPGGAFAGSAMTAPNGDFSLGPASEGYYLATITANGFRDAIVEYHVPATGSVALGARLLPSTGSLAPIVFPWY